MSAFLRHWWPVFIPLGLLAGILVAGGFAIGRDQREGEAHHLRFMSACLLDHKLYECEALWGDTQGRSSGVLP